MRAHHVIDADHGNPRRVAREIAALLGGAPQ
jgi:hypothetical protein